MLYLTCRISKLMHSDFMITEATASKMSGNLSTFRAKMDNVSVNTDVTQESLFCISICRVIRL